MDDNIRFSCTHRRCVDSTNKYIRENATRLWAAAGTADALVVTADFQTAGRGQQGNVWLSQQGDNLLMSILVRPQFLTVDRQFALSQTIALALHDAMSLYGIDVQIKWPNDIYADEKKLSGILVEIDYAAAHIEQAVIGVGLNINQRRFEPMSRVPVSMSMLTNREFSVPDVQQTLLRCFAERYAVLRRGAFDDISSAYMRLLKGYGVWCRYKDTSGVFNAKMVGVSPNGYLLLLRDDDVRLQYAFKQVEQLF